MKIIDETGAVIENPDLTLGYLTNGTEEITHPAVEGVEELFHYETVAEYPSGGKDVQKIIDRPGVQAQEEWWRKYPSRSTSAIPPKSWPCRKKRAKRLRSGRSCRKRWRRCKKKTRC